MTNAQAWEAVARNLAMALEGENGDGIRMLTEQAKAHGLTLTPPRKSDA
jgi:hypothetical protein